MTERILYLSVGESVELLAAGHTEDAGGCAASTAVWSSSASWTVTLSSLTGPRVHATAVAVGEARVRVEHHTSRTEISSELVEEILWTGGITDPNRPTRPKSRDATALYQRPVVREQASTLFDVVTIKVYDPANPPKLCGLAIKIGDMKGSK